MGVNLTHDVAQLRGSLNLAPTAAAAAAAVADLTKNKEISKQVACNL